MPRRTPPGPTRRRLPIRRAAVAVAAVALVASTFAGAPTPTSASPAPPDGPKAVTSPLRIATYNASVSAPIRTTAADLRAIAAEGPDLIALQEMASSKRRKAVAQVLVDCKGCVYAAYAPTGKSAVPAGTPIYYRTDKYTLLGSGSVKLTENTYVGPQGAGPATIRAKYANWVQLRDQTTKRKITLINNHFVPTVQKSSGGPNSNTRRTELYRKHMTGLTGLINQLRSERGGQFFLTGDFNVNYRGDKVVRADLFPYAALGQLSIYSSFQNIGEPKEGTHVLSNGFSKRLIDYVFNLKRRAVVPDGHRIMFGLGSDHRPVLADFTLKSRGCFVDGNTC